MGRRTEAPPGGVARPGPAGGGIPAAGSPPVSMPKKALFVSVFYVGIAAVAELGLWAVGVPTLIEREDPSRGFSGLLHVFRREGSLYRTAPANRGKTFNDQTFLARKPANGLRLFCLGGSSSYGYPWGAEAAFTGVVGEALAAAHRDRRVEAVNASGISYAMHRLGIVADELLGYEPDLFLVYEGHNEFIETAFFESLKHRGRVRSRLEHVAAHSRVYSAIHGMIGGSGARSRRRGGTSRPRWPATRRTCGRPRRRRRSWRSSARASTAS